MQPDLILPYGGALPTFAGPPVRCGPGSTAIGAVRAGARAWIGHGAVIRADGQAIVLGADVWLGSRVTVHIATATHGTAIGDRVTVGANACVHACTVGSDVVIEDDAVILDRAAVGDGAVIEAGSTVYPRTELAGGFIYGGSPARALRPVAAGEVRARAEGLRGRMRAEADGGTGAAPEAGAPRVREDDVFVARTARLRGRVGLGAGASVLFGCTLEAEAGPIAVGAGTNIQDNTAILTRGAGVVIGRDTTVAHNVRIADCRIGAGSLVGIGATIAPGTLIADDVLLAAGAATEPGQILGSGHLWGGRPARILAPLDAGRRAMMARIVAGYRVHGREYRAAQDGLT